jgi:hypothetical protein
MAHVKPKNRQSWDVHADIGFNIMMAMEHHQCFHIYIVKTRATKISDTVPFKQQYITNLQVTSKSLVVKVASDLTSALKGAVSCNGKTAEVLQKFSKLFTKIAAEKAELAKAKSNKKPSKAPQCLPSCTTSKGAKRPSTPAKPPPSRDGKK